MLSSATPGTEANGLGVLPQAVRGKGRLLGLEKWSFIGLLDLEHLLGHKVYNSGSV